MNRSAFAPTDVQRNSHSAIARAAASASFPFTALMFSTQVSSLVTPSDVHTG